MTTSFGPAAARWPPLAAPTSDSRAAPSRSRHPPRPAPLPSRAAARQAGEPRAMDVKPKLLEAKVRLHRRLIDELNLAALEKLPSSRSAPRDPRHHLQWVVAERLPLNAKELDGFVSEVLDEMFGLGPIEPLLKDPTITDILINGHENVFVERSGVLEPTPVRFKDEAHLLRIIHKIVSAVGRRVDESTPMVRRPPSRRHRASTSSSGRSRVDGPLVSIRKFSKRRCRWSAWSRSGAIRPQMADAPAGRRQGAHARSSSPAAPARGKTTMLNALSRYIPPTERLITIEDAAELQLQQPHVARLETRPPNIEGKGEIRQRDLVKNALRMRPDRIILGECRGDEAFDMLQAMNTGHEGSMTTIHANTPRDAHLAASSR